MLSKNKAVIDRVEGSYAVVLFEDKNIKLDIPLDLLPKEVKEGTWLKISFEVDQETTDAQRQKVSNLIEKLKNK